jgi:hypothetical protein
VAAGRNPERNNRQNAAVLSKFGFAMAADELALYMENCVGV